MPVADAPQTEASSRSFGALTAAFLGQEMSMTALLELIESTPVNGNATPVLSPNGVVPLWVGSVGYERYRDVDDFARLLADAGVERLIDVRELPISRRRGFAKTALGNALGDQGVEYRHLRALGNPKEFRDLYKSGSVEAGRAGYQRFLLDNREDELRGLETVLREKRSALMCVEHDENVCHRQVIFEVLRDRVGIELDITHIG